MPALILYSHSLGCSCKEALAWLLYWICWTQSTAHSLALFVCVAKWPIRMEVKNTATPNTHFCLTKQAGTSFSLLQVLQLLHKNHYDQLCKKSSAWVIVSIEAKHGEKQRAERKYSFPKVRKYIRNQKTLSAGKCKSTCSQTHEHSGLELNFSIHLVKWW